MAVRKGDWIQTFTGGQFWPLDPRVDEVNIVDIAAALSKLCRYGGHCLEFLSVAEHSVLMARHAPKDLRLEVLLHDAAEAYLIDLPRPIKNEIKQYKKLELRLMEVIADKFGLQYPFPPIVKELDESIGLDEVQQNMAPTPENWLNYETLRPLGVKIELWHPKQAFEEFMREYAACGQPKLARAA